jgi:hypothetical protein
MDLIAIEDKYYDYLLKWGNTPDKNTDIGIDIYKLINDDIFNKTTKNTHMMILRGFDLKDMFNDMSIVSKLSFEISKIYKPEIWIENWLNLLDDFLENNYLRRQYTDTIDKIKYIESKKCRCQDLEKRLDFIEEKINQILYDDARYDEEVEEITIEKYYGNLNDSDSDYENNILSDMND